MSAGKPPSHDWRAHPPTRSAYAREWRGAGNGTGSRFSRLFKLRLVTVGLIVLVSSIAVLLVPMAASVPKVQMVTFGIGAYGGQTNPRGVVPVNPFGEQDAGAFQILSDRNPNQFLPIRQEMNALNGDQFLEFWGKERSSDKLARQNLIVFCTMHGWVQSNGEVKLFAIDATPESRSKLISLRDLIALLEESPARRVLLFLDITRLRSSWRMGILSNDTTEQIASDWPAEVHERIKADRSGPERSGHSKVTILLAAGPGQQSWPREAKSSFAHSLVEGLLGDADGWETVSATSRDSGRHDQRISLKELTAYAGQKIEDWALRRYGMRQSIRLLGNVSDFDLASVSPSLAAIARNTAKIVDPKGKTKSAEVVEIAASSTEPKTESKAEPKTDSKTEAVPVEVQWDARLANELWKTRDQWREESGKVRPAVRRQAPLAWRTFEAYLALAETLRRSHQDKLAVSALQQADAVCKRLNEQSTAPAGLNWTPAESQLIQNWGFYFEANNPARDAIAAAGKFLLAEQPPTDNSDPSAKPPSATPAVSKLPEPSSTAIRAWLIQEMQRESTPENWTRLRQIVGKIPATPDVLLLRDVMEPKSGTYSLRAVELLPQIFELRDRIRRLSMRVPESWPRVMNDVRSSVRSLNAAERWLLAADASRPEVRDWLRKSADAIAKAELIASRYGEAVGIWSDLLSELPAIAEWVATRAGDDEHRSVDWLRTLADQWIQQEKQGRWDASQLLNVWPEKPKRLADLERGLLAQFVDAQRLKQAFFSTAGQQMTADDLAKVVNEASAHRRDFWQEFPLFFSPLELSSPSPIVWRESLRLLEQPWLPIEERIKLEKLQSDVEAQAIGTASNSDERSTVRQIKNVGEILPDRSVAADAVWQGFWGIATQSLLSRTADDTADLWKDWDRLVERFPASATTLTESEKSDLRRRRSELGQKIYERSKQLPTNTANLSEIHLVAAGQDPFLSPENDPDIQIRDERQRQFAAWIALFSEDWRSRVTGANSLAHSALAQSAEELARGLLRSPTTTDAALPAPRKPQPQLQDIDRPSFNADRLGQLRLTRASTGDSAAASHLVISATRARLIEGKSSTALDQSVLRPLLPDGTFAANLRLDDGVESPQSLLVVLTELDGYPLDFRDVPLNPPFDPAQWRIEFTEAKTTVPLETEPLSRVDGVKIYLPPSGQVSLSANLIRPTKDVTPSAKIAIYRLNDSNPASQKELLGTSFDLKLEPGTIRTPLVFDFPEVPKEKANPKDAVPVDSTKDLSRGWLFEITPEGQPSLNYTVRPTFYSAVNFINEPKPIVRDDRLTLALERPVLAKDGLLPKKVPVELHVPDSFRKSLTDYTLSGALEMGQRLTLSFALPKNWNELALDRNLNIALDVAGLPHSYIWRIEPSGDLTPIAGQPPHLEIRLIQPAPEGKNPPRLKPVVLIGKDSLNLQFQVNASELDRTEAVGDWTLRYTVSRESAKGLEPTTLQNSWRMFSSLDRHVALQGVQAGVWAVQTSATDYGKETPETDIRGMSGRFQVQADLIRADDPLPVGSAKYRFAIDDDRAPDVKVVWGGASGTKSTDKDLAFQIEATDLESGIQRIAYGFDLNGDEVLQEAKELLDENIPDKSGAKLDNPKLNWGVRIGKSKLPKLAKDKEEEAKTLIVQVQNGLGIVKTRVEQVTLRKPAMSVAPAKTPVGTLVVKLKVNRGAKSSVQITGPDTRSEQTAEDSVTFSNLKPGRYEIKVKVSYAVVGTKAAGEETVDVKADETATADVSLSTSK